MGGQKSFACDPPAPTVPAGDREIDIRGSEYETTKRDVKAIDVDGQASIGLSGGNPASPERRFLTPTRPSGAIKGGLRPVGEHARDSLFLRFQSSTIGGGPLLRSR